MLKRIKDSIFDILRQADWTFAVSLLRRALFGLVMIASATNFLNSWKMVIVRPAPLCWEWASIFSCPRST